MRPLCTMLAVVALTLGACQSPPPASGGPGAGSGTGHAEVHWAYAGEAGPAHWGQLDKTFAMCAIGRNQSPVDLAHTVKAELEPLRFDYRPGASGIRNNGHTVQVDYAPGSTVTVDGTAFTLTQFHFHAPGENTFDGRRFPLEGHFVHVDQDGNIAVVAVMYEEGAAHPALADLWRNLPASEGATGVVPAGANAAALLPADRGYYRFEGSLTTPPCSEGVRWLVLAHPVAVSPAQVAQFAAALPGPNNRPVQPLNARVVLR